MTQTNLESPLLDRIGGYVAGAWITEGDTFDVHDPADGSLLARVPRLGAQHARDAVEAARDALAGGPVPIAARQERLHDIASLLHESSAELARIITRENGKPLSEARAEVAYAAGFYAHAAEEVPHLASRVLDERPRDHRWTVHHRAAGVAALITPWNFPIAMLAKKLSAAIAAGCTTVIKPARATPLTCIAFVRLLERLELAPGEVNLVVGDAGPIGDVLAEHPAVRVISFTGSTAVGQKLAAKAAPTLKRLSLELGGNAPCLVFADADLDAAVERLVANKFRASGQTCVCTNRVLVDAAVADAFTERLAARVGSLITGPGTLDGVDVGPLIDGDGWDKVLAHVDDAVAKGARIARGKRPDARPSPDAGWFFEPMVLAGVPKDALCFREETFGPIVPITTFESEDEAVELANDTDAGLAAYVFTGDSARAERVIARLSYGHVGHNTGTGPTPEAPFGGMRQSGYGREGGLEGLLEYVEIQTVPTAP